MLAGATLAATLTALLVPGLPAHAAATTTFAAQADTHVDQTSAKASFGSGKRISAGQSPQRRAFLKFTVTGLTGSVTQAKLRLHVSRGSAKGATFHGVSDTGWTEQMTWKSQPSLDGAALAGPSLRTGQWAEVDVRKLVTGNGTVSIGITSSSADGVSFGTRESGAKAPQLLVTTESLGNDPVLVGAGDISSCYLHSDEATAKLLDTIPGTVFMVGDAVYPDGSLPNLMNCYDPTWGRHKARTRPVPGNHEYRDPGAAGYFDYFGAAAGARDKGYYSYDLGTWHIVVLNSNCLEVACAAGSPQEQWLRADLAANNRQCTLAFWHHPLFTSGLNHQAAPETLPFFQALYEAGAEVVVGGHNHQYERFAPQNPAGLADPASGIRQFVAGMGGAKQYPFTTVAPNSEARNDDTFGVLKLILRPASYDWEFIAVDGKTYTDMGTGSCH